MELPSNNRINQRRYKPGKRATLAQLRVKVKRLSEEERLFRKRVASATKREG